MGKVSLHSRALFIVCGSKLTFIVTGAGCGESKVAVLNGYDRNRRKRHRNGAFMKRARACINL